MKLADALFDLQNRHRSSHFLHGTPYIILKDTIDVGGLSHRGITKITPDEHLTQTPPPKEAQKIFSSLNIKLADGRETLISFCFQPVPTLITAPLSLW